MSSSEKDYDNVKQLTRERVGLDTLERYTGSLIADFQDYILLTNYTLYLQWFAQHYSMPILQGSVMQTCHHKEQRISMINFNVGSPTAALIIELLSFIKPKAVLMLGLCGGLRENYAVGHYFNPIAAIREEGTSDAYLPKRCPSLSSFVIQRYVCKELEYQHLKYHNGVIHTTNVRFWEFNDHFCKMLSDERAQAIDMECATLFTVGFARLVPVGALMLISDLPLNSDGIKTNESSKHFFDTYKEQHIKTGVSVLNRMQKDEENGFHYNF